MDSDLTSLHRRIRRLETLLLDAPATPAAPSHTLASQLGDAHTALSTLVPNEMAAAHRALTLLSCTASLRPATRDAHLSTLSDLVSASERPVAQLQALLPPALPVGSALANDDPNSSPAPGPECHMPPVVPPHARVELRALRARAGRVATLVDREDADVDTALTAFDAATARLNATLHTLACQLRALSSSAATSSSEAVPSDGAAAQASP